MTGESSIWYRLMVPQAAAVSALPPIDFRHASLPERRLLSEPSLTKTMFSCDMLRKTSKTSRSATWSMGMTISLYHSALADIHRKLRENDVETVMCAIEKFATTYRETLNSRTSVGALRRILRHRIDSAPHSCPSTTPNSGAKDLDIKQIDTNESLDNSPQNE